MDGYLKANELVNQPGHYLVYGPFSHFDGVHQPCITVVNELGVIQENYFQNHGAPINFFNDNDVPFYPSINVVDQLENGDLLIGGGFSEFMGEEHYNVVRLTQGFLNVEDSDLSIGVEVYPNPVGEILTIRLSDLYKNSSIEIYNTNGKCVLQKNTNNAELGIDVGDYPSGIYFIQVARNGRMFKGKFIKQ